MTCRHDENTPVHREKGAGVIDKPSIEYTTLLVTTDDAGTKQVCSGLFARDLR